MQKNIVLASIVAIFAFALFASFAAAASSLDLTVNEIEIDGFEITSSDFAVEAGDRIPVTIEFEAMENATDVEISAWFQGHRSDTFVEDDFADLIDGRDYKLRLAVDVPSDLDDPEEDLTLIVRIESDEGNHEEEIELSGQRQSELVEVLLVDFDTTVNAGETVPVSVVLKNMGRHEAEDTFVTVRIPELGISRTAFFEDIAEEDLCDLDDGDCDKTDARERRIFLNIPGDANAGNYEMQVSVFSEDSRTDIDSTVVRSITVLEDRVEGQVLANPSAKTMAVGQEVSYDLVLVNSGNKIAIYNIAPDASDALSIRLSEPVAIVPAGSSKTVKVHVTANREGTFPFFVNVESDSFSQAATYTATVEGRAALGSNASASNNVVALTIVLAIIFVVLVIILVVLLTRRPESTEEFGESYY